MSKTGTCMKQNLTGKKPIYLVALYFLNIICKSHHGLYGFKILPCIGFGAGKTGKSIFIYVTCSRRRSLGAR